MKPYYEDDAVSDKLDIKQQHDLDRGAADFFERHEPFEDEREELTRIIDRETTVGGYHHLLNDSILSDVVEQIFSAGFRRTR